MDKFIVVRISKEWPMKIESVTHFDNAKDVATSLWGASISRYHIYKDGKLAQYCYFYPNISDLEQYLDGNIENPERVFLG